MKLIYFCWIIFTEAVGAIAGFLIRNDTKIYASEIEKPLLSPSPLVFPIVWTILYALMGISAARIFASEKSKHRTKGLCFFMLQLGFNFVWCFIFFTFQNFAFALVWLTALIIFTVLMIFHFYKVERFSAYLQIPYLMWLMFAAYLNYGVMTLN